MPDFGGPISRRAWGMGVGGRRRLRSESCWRVGERYLPGPKCPSLIFVLMEVVITILLKSIFICFNELSPSAFSSIPSSTHLFYFPFLKYIPINTIYSNNNPKNPHPNNERPNALVRSPKPRPQFARAHTPHNNPKAYI